MFVFILFYIFSWHIFCLTHFIDQSHFSAVNFETRAAKALFVDVFSSREQQQEVNSRLESHKTIRQTEALDYTKQEPLHGSLIWWVILSNLKRLWTKCIWVFMNGRSWMFVRSRAKPVPGGCAVNGWETEWEEFSRKHHPGKSRLSQENNSQLQRERHHVWNTSKYTSLQFGFTHLN